MVFMPNKSSPDYLFEKANQCFRRARADSNARVELEALGNEFMVEAIDLDIKLQNLAKGNYTASSPRTGVTTMDKPYYERTDYSVVVKNRAPPPRAWRWEIYRAGNANPIKQSSIYFDTTAAARRAGKDALKELLNKLFN